MAIRRHPPAHLEVLETLGSFTLLISNFDKRKVLGSVSLSKHCRSPCLCISSIFVQYGLTFFNISTSRATPRIYTSMALYSDAPPPRKFSDDKPTLLVSWWITIFCMGIILTRLAGRYVRVEKLLREDKIVATALLPLVMRAVCVHFILRYGTNNVSLEGYEMNQDEIDKRIIGSRLVMASRIFYAAVLVHPSLEDGR